MNFIATVNTPAHGHISVTFSDNEKSVLGAWRDNVTIELSGKEKQQITNDIICNRRHKRVFEKAYVSTSGFGIFIFPVRSGRFCQSKLIEFATQIALWVKTESGFDFSEQEAVDAYRQQCHQVQKRHLRSRNRLVECLVRRLCERGVRKQPHSHHGWQVRGRGWKRPSLFVHQLPQGYSETARELSGEPKGNGQGIFGKRLGLPLCRKPSGRSPESCEKISQGRWGSAGGVSAPEPSR